MPVKGPSRVTRRKETRILTGTDIILTGFWVVLDSAGAAAASEQERGNDTGEKDAIEGAGAADAGNRSAKLPDAV